MIASNLSAPGPALVPAAGDDAATLRLIFRIVVLAYVGAFAYVFLAGWWLVDSAGRAIEGDFINVWAAGKMALEGNAAGAYDWAQHRAYETLGLGHPIDDYFGWHYPPMFFLIAAPLALAPYVASHIVWMAATLPLYVGAIRLIVGRSGAALAALAFPGAALNFAFGQNGYFTAALLGAGLALLRSRPVLAGVMFGLLTYKPHFGLLLPIALLAGGHWRTIAAAAVTAIAVAALATAAFGPEVWPAFLASTKLTNHAVLEQGWANFGELLSLFGVVRWLGGSVALAWALQGALCAGLAVAVWRTWRGGGDPALACATLAAACLLASPYAYIYDLTALAVAIAFLARAGCSVGERQLVGVVCVLILGGPVTETPVAVLAAPIILAIALKKVRAGSRSVAA